MLEIPCPNPDCPERYFADESQVGRKLQCTRCGIIIEVSRAATAPSQQKHAASVTTPAREATAPTAARQQMASVAAPAREPLRERKLSWWYMVGPVAFPCLVAITVWLLTTGTQPGAVRDGARSPTPASRTGPAAGLMVPPYEPVPLVRSEPVGAPDAARHSPDTVPAQVVPKLRDDGAERPLSAAPILRPIPVDRPTVVFELPTQPVRLANGTAIIPPLSPSGLGSVTIENGTDYDALVKLVTGLNASQGGGDGQREPLLHRFVYIQSRHSADLGQIRPGTYDLLFCVGEDWNDAARAFRKKHGASRFEQPLEFSEVTDPYTGDVRYRGYSLTLQPVPGGAARTEGIGTDDFDRIQ